MSTFLEPKCDMANLRLKAGQVHLWLASLERCDDEFLHLKNFLSEDEINRSKQFRFKKDSRHNIVSRGILRDILSLYLKKRPNEITFSYQLKGKPIVAHSDIHFNLSHSNNLLLVGISLVPRIGVDIEYINRQSIDMFEIAKKHFAREEYMYMQTIRSAKQRTAFFSFWTCKEAYAKAIGEGLYFPLEDVVLDLEKKPVLKRIRHSQSDEKKWSVYIKDFNQDYIGSVAVESRSPQIIEYTYSSSTL